MVNSWTFMFKEKNDHSWLKEKYPWVPCYPCSKEKYYSCWSLFDVESPAMRVIHHLARQPDGSQAPQATGKTTVAIEHIRINALDLLANSQHLPGNPQRRERLRQVHLLHPIHHVAVSALIIVAGADEVLLHPPRLQSWQQHLEIPLHPSCTLCNMHYLHRPNSRVCTTN